MKFLFISTIIQQSNGIKIKKGGTIYHNPTTATITIAMES